LAYFSSAFLLIEYLNRL